MEEITEQVYFKFLGEVLNTQISYEGTTFIITLNGMMCGSFRSPFSTDYKKILSRIVGDMLSEYYCDYDGDVYNGINASQYFSIRLNKAIDVYGGKIFKMYINYHNLSNGAIKDIIHVKTRARDGNFHRLYIYMKHALSDDEFRYFVSDMKTFPSGFVQHLISMLLAHYVNRNNPITYDDYLGVIKAVPKQLRNCKYAIHPVPEMLEYNPRPQSRIQWYMTRVVEDECSTKIKDFDKYIYNKLVHITLDDWRYYANNRPHVRDMKRHHYSLSNLSLMMRYLIDAKAIYEDNVDNSYNMKFVQIKGSIKKMIQRSVYNHNQEKKIRLYKLLETDDKDLPTAKVELTPYLESIRLKTTHDIIRAGIECDHCIGSYTRSPDIFVREGDICAQISHITFKIKQCYDKDDMITDNSEKFEEKLKTEIQKMKVYEDTDSVCFNANVIMN